VDGDYVGAVGELGAAGDGQVAVVVVGDGDPARFGGDVQAVVAGVVGEDVGVLADPVVAGDTPGVEVEGEQAGVGVAGDERQAVGGVAGGAAVQDGAGVLVDGGHLVVAAGCCVDPVQGRDDEDSVDVGQAVDRSYDAARVDVDLDDLARAEMGDEHQTPGGV